MIFEDLVCERNNTILVGIKFYMPENLLFLLVIFWLTDSLNVIKFLFRVQSAF